MHVAVARWKESMQALGLRTWLKFNACMAREEDASRHKVARMRSIVQHMQYRSLSMCMGKWQNRLRRIHLKRRVAARIVHLKISSAMSGWMKFVEARQFLRHRLTVALHRWENAALAAGFRTWSKFAVSMTRYQERTRSRIAHEVELDRYQEIQKRLSDALAELRQKSSKLLNCEAERRGLHEAVEWYKRELEEVGVLGKKWQETARALESQNEAAGDVTSLRLQYASLLRTHQELCAQVDSISWREGLLESESVVLRPSSSSN
jgi:hypothetical protein